MIVSYQNMDKTIFVPSSLVEIEVTEIWCSTFSDVQAPTEWPINKFHKIEYLVNGDFIINLFISNLVL